MKKHQGKAAFIFIVIFLTVAITHAQEVKYTINLKTESIVIGPQITLGDIAQIQVIDDTYKTRLCALILCISPPPGEARELSMGFIERKIKEAGFNPKMISFSGPKIVRITAAQIEIHKIFFREEIT